MEQTHPTEVNCGSARQEITLTVSNRKSVIAVNFLQM